MKYPWQRIYLKIKFSLAAKPDVDPTSQWRSSTAPGAKPPSWSTLVLRTRVSQSISPQKQRPSHASRRPPHHPAASQPGPRSAAPALRAHPSTCALGASDGHTHLPQERGGGRTDHVHRTTAKGSHTHRTTANGSHTPRTTAIANDSEPTTAKCSCAKQTPKRGHTRRASQCTPRETRGKCIVICQ